MLLQLDFSPRADDIERIRDIWAYAFTTAIGRIDERLDRPRINKAFLSSHPVLKKWPSPAMIIELMPRRPEAERITFDPEVTEESSRQFHEMCQELATRLSC